jgi:hypothetical protein
MNRKSELLARKYKDIQNDFKKLHQENKMRVGAIYDELSDKYYLDQETIFRICLGLTKFQKANDREAQDLPPPV